MPTDLIDIVSEYLPPEGRVFFGPDHKGFSGRKTWIVDRNFAHFKNTQSGCWRCGRVALLDVVGVRTSQVDILLKFAFCFRCSRTSLEDMLEEGLLIMPMKIDTGHEKRTGRFYKFMFADNQDLLMHTAVMYKTHSIGLLVLINPRLHRTYSARFMGYQHSPEDIVVDRYFDAPTNELKQAMIEVERCLPRAINLV